MNLGTLRSAVLANMGTDANDGLITTSMVNTMLTRAVHVVEQESDWPWLETQETLTTTASVGTVTPGSVGQNWLRTRWLEDQYGKNMEWYSHAELDDRFTNTQTGFPKFFSVYGDLIHLRPVPDGVYTITHFYQRVEADLVSDSDTPLLPATYHTALIEYASYLAFRASRETERSNQSFQNYQELLKQMKQRAKRRVDLPGKVRVRPGSWL